MKKGIFLMGLLALLTIGTVTRADNSSEVDDFFSYCKDIAKSQLVPSPNYINTDMKVVFGQDVTNVDIYFESTSKNHFLVEAGFRVLNKYLDPVFEDKSFVNSYEGEDSHFEKEFVLLPSPLNMSGMVIEACAVFSSTDGELSASGRRIVVVGGRGKGDSIFFKISEKEAEEAASEAVEDGTYKVIEAVRNACKEKGGTLRGPVPAWSKGWLRTETIGDKFAASGYKEHFSIDAVAMCEIDIADSLKPEVGILHTTAKMLSNLPGPGYRR